VRPGAAWLTCLLTGFALAAPAAADVLRVAEMTAVEIAALDRARTVVILPGGILEQHGPHLPSWSDGYANEKLAEELAQAVSRRPGWTALVFPTIPLGTGGANEIGGRFGWPGTYALREDTLRSVFMDLAGELGDQGFRWVFVVHGHGSPWHNRALDEAGDFFRDTFGGRMVNLTGLEPDWKQVAAARQGLVTPVALAEDASSVHAGLSETSHVLALRPDLVRPAYKELPSVTTPMPQLVATASAPGWAGYFGAPRHATAELGRAEMAAAHRLWIEIAGRILDGADERAMTRYADTMLAIPPIEALGDRSAAKDRELADRQAAWLRKRTR
jgi:creatinine amidohydrolase/Fe(II)-dependent formamide hydrolase-like protein